MNIGDEVSRTVVSTGLYKGQITREVITKYYAGTMKGNKKYHSRTSHTRG